MKTAPEVARTTAGAWTRPTEAEQAALERANWTLRGHLRRMTRLSNGFSRKRANLRAALALFFVYYNFCKFHRSIRMTPAMAAGIARKPWSLADLLKAAQATAAATAAGAIL
jgi:hypothetical protein